MNMLRLPVLLVCTLVAMPGCDPETEEVTATASESADGSSGGSGDTSGSDGDSTSGGSSASGTSMGDASASSSNDTSASGTDGDSDGSSETGIVEGCAAASDATACQDTPGCAWWETSHVALDIDMACGDLGIEEGYCLQVEGQGPECGSTPVTCPDGTGVYYREAGLEVGAVELLILDSESLCEVPDGFEACQVNSDPKPGSEPSYFPEECACACA